MSNSSGYRGNPAIYAQRARILEQQQADYAAALKALADAEAEVAEAARREAEAALVLPATRRVKPTPPSAKEH